MMALLILATLKSSEPCAREWPTPLSRRLTWLPCRRVLTDYSWSTLRAKRRFIMERWDLSERIDHRLNVPVWPLVPLLVHISPIFSRKLVNGDISMVDSVILFMFMGKLIGL